MKYSVQSGRNTKNEVHAHFFREMRDSSMSFMPNLPKKITTYNSQSIGVGTQLTFPKSMGNNTIFLFQKV